MVAAQRADVSALALWDPIVSGPAYLDELLEDARRRAQPYGAAGGHGSGTLGVMGYPVTESLRNELSSLPVASVPAAAASRTLVMCREDTVEARGLTALIASKGGHATFRHEAIQGRWDEVDNWGSAMIPQAAIQALVEWFVAEVQ